MRLQLFSIIVCLFCVHSFAAVKGQSVTLSVERAPLEKVLSSIESQTGYIFMFNSKIVVGYNVTAKLKDASIQEAVKQTLTGLPFKFQIIDKTILITSAPQPAPAPAAEVAVAEEIISGRITDKEGRGIPGVTIKVKGTTRGVATDENGNYKITAGKNDVLTITAVGFNAVELSVGGRTTISVTLSDKVGQMDEFVAKGYYSTSRALNTGNVSSVKSQDLAKQPVGDVLMALEGRVPGLYISQNSGITGSALSVKLRGQNSIGNGNAPLYVIDNIPYNSTNILSGSVTGAVGGINLFSTLRMNDIESIEVLKDADATAIYGSRGANGVILITTKKGKQGKTNVDLNVYTGTGEAKRRLKLMNTAEYLQMRRAAMANDNITTIPATAYDLNGRFGDVNQYTDWQDVMIGGTANVTDGQLSISGGNANTQFLFGGGYREEGTVFPGDYRDRRISGNASISHESNNSRFKSSLSLNYVNDNNRVPVADFTSNLLIAPNGPKIYNEDGSFNWQNSLWENPLWYSTLNSVNTTDSWTSSLNASYTILKGLNFGVRAGYSDIDAGASQLTPYEKYDPAVPILPSYRTNVFGTSRVKSWIVEPGLNYDFKLWIGKVESLVSATFQENMVNGITQTASGFASVAVMKNISAASNVKVNSVSESQYRYTAILGRIGYNIEDKYILNLTGRRDGSSRFGPGRQFGNFGAVGVAWLFKRENFMSGLSWLSFGKLRGSFGITGNDQLGDYKYLSTYSANGVSYQGTVGLVPTQLTNTEFGWETVKKVEAGLELGFLNGRVNSNFSWYRHRTGNQLVGYSLPDITGFPSVQANLPAILQNTGFEAEITSQNITNSKFTWQTSANISIPRNKLVSYPNLAGSSNASLYTIGEPLSSRYYYRYTGIDPVTQLYTFEDLNKDGKITFSNDKLPYTVQQDFFGGLNNSFTYKGFKLDLFVQYVKQNGFELLSTIPGVFSITRANQQAYLLDNKDVQRFTSSAASPAAAAYVLFTESDGAIIDASFIRLKNISFSWEVPQNFLEKVHFNKVRLYLQGQNLATITKFKGLDPEISGFSTSAGLRLPPLRIITAGIQISL